MSDGSGWYTFCLSTVVTQFGIQATLSQYGTPLRIVSVVMGSLPGFKYVSTELVSSVAHFDSRRGLARTQKYNEEIIKRERKGEGWTGLLAYPKRNEL